MKLNKKTIAVSTASLVLVGGASAFAYLNATGSGTGTATVTNTAPTFTDVSGTPIAEISALDVAVGVDVALTAPSNGMHVSSITVAPDAANALWPAACDATFVHGSSTAAGFSVTYDAGHQTLAAATSGLTLTLANDSAHSQAGCLGASLPLKVTIN